jgi:hypothetical protein
LSLMEGGAIGIPGHGRLRLFGGGRDDSLAERGN